MFSFPIGTSDFKELRQSLNNPVYIDKTALIYEIFASDSKALLFTRPIRFMKTMNMSMIATFCDIRSREENAMLFEGLKIKDISQPEYKRIWDTHFGQYPVIFLSFKDVSPGDYSAIFARIKTIITRLYKVHNYLLNSDLILPEDKLTLSQIINGQASAETYQESLFFLSECLHAHYKKRVMILIDEYDTPLHHTHLYTEEQKERGRAEENNAFNETLEFMRTFLKAGLKDNAFLHKGIMTGVLRTAFGSLVSALNNVDVFSVLSQDANFSPYFGVTEEEIANLLELLGIQEQNDMREILKVNYNGYSVSGTILYNPWSVMRYLRSYVNSHGEALQGESHWLQTGDSSIIGLYLRKHFSVVRKDLEFLLTMQPLEIVLKEKSTFSQASDGDVAAFWGLLLQCGYLTVVEVSRIINLDVVCKVRIPNDEVYGAYAYYVQRFLAPEFSQQGNARFMETLLRHDFDGFAAHLQRYLHEVVSYFDIQQTRAPEARNVRRKAGSGSTQEISEKTGDEFLILPEMVFHVLVMGIIAGLHQVQYLLLSNRESGEGRHDLMLLPCSAEKPGMIFEFKKTDSLRELEPSAQQALTQIKVQQYPPALEAYGVTYGLHIGIAFFGKTLCLKHEAIGYHPSVAFRLREPISEIITQRRQQEERADANALSSVRATTFAQSNTNASMLPSATTNRYIEKKKWFN